MKKTSTNRRRFLRQAMGIPLLNVGWSPTFLPGFAWTARAAENNDHNRFLLVFLAGGWDSALATDPVLGSKALSGNYQDIYLGESTATVPGKSQLILGSGLIPAAKAFEQVPTTFINGMHIEVPAHDLASQQVLTGVFNLSRTADIAGFVAKMGAAAGGFPSHVILGVDMPLAETALTAPPLKAIGLGGLQGHLTPPGHGYNLTAPAMAKINATIANLNLHNRGAIGPQSSAALKSFRASEQAILPLYEQGYAENLKLTPAIKEQYGAQNGIDTAGKFASAAIVFKSGLARFLSIGTHGFDTHSGHFPAHRSLIEEVARGLTVLVNDLLNTPDPHYPGDSMMDHTTICMTSEFVRTPKFNDAQGTDHWQSASAILMGRGVRDNQIIGRTDDAAKPLGWQQGQAVPLHVDTQIGPDHLAATILQIMGFSALAKTLGETLDDALA